MKRGTGATKRRNPPSGVRILGALALAIAIPARGQSDPVRIVGPDGRPLVATDAPIAPEPAPALPWGWLAMAGAAPLAAAAGAGVLWRRWGRLPAEERAFRLLALHLGLGHAMRARIKQVARAAKVSPLAIALSPDSLERWAPAAQVPPEDVAALLRRLR